MGNNSIISPANGEPGLNAIFGELPLLWRSAAKFKSPDSKTRAFFTKAYFRPACDGVHAGGAMVYIGSKGSEGSFTESLRQTMKTDEQIDRLAECDPYFFSPTRLFSHKTEIERIAENGNKGRNTYCCIGHFWGYAYHKGGRLIKNIKSVDRFVIDVDGPDHRVLTKKEKRVISDEIQGKLGKADFVIDSGSGIQLHYIFKERTDIFAIEKAYNTIENELCKRAEESIKSVPGCHADRLKMNSYYRLPLTFNQRSQSKVTVLEFNDLQPLDFDYLAQFFGCRIIPIEEKRQAKNSLKISIERDIKCPKSYTGFESKLEHDYAILAKNLGSQGRRNKILYYYLYNIQAVVTESDELTLKAMAINGNFADPLATGEVKTIVRSAINEFQIHQRIFSFSSQLKKIGITPEELTSLDLLLPVTEEQKSERKKQATRKQNERRKELRHTKKMEKINKVVALHAAGLSIQKISETTGVCRQTVSKWIKENV